MRSETFTGKASQEGSAESDDSRLMLELPAEERPRLQATVGEEGLEVSSEAESEQFNQTQENVQPELEAQIDALHSEEGEGCDGATETPARQLTIPRHYRNRHI